MLNQIAKSTVYDPEDVVWLSRGLPLRGLMKARGALRILHAQVLVLTDLSGDLPHCDKIRLEPLDFAYAYLRCLGAYDTDLRDDLLLRSTHPQLVTLGGFLVLLSPQETDLPTLEQSVDVAGGDSWVVNLALRRARGESAGSCEEHLSLIGQLRDALSAVTPPRKPLLKIADIPRREMSRLQADMRDAYRAGDAEAAHVLLAEATAADGALGAYLRNRRDRKS